MIINKWLSDEKKWTGVTTEVFPDISLGLGLPSILHVGPIDLFLISASALRMV